MPPLASMSLNPGTAQSPPAQSYTAGSGSYYPPQPQPIRQSVHSPPAEAQIQSWADNVPPQQPKPMPPIPPVANMQGTWAPDMGIKFAPSPRGGTSPNQQQSSGNVPPVKGTWEPSKGIRFG